MQITKETRSIEGHEWLTLKAVEKNWETWQKRMMDQLRPSFLLPFEMTLEPNELRFDHTGKIPLSSRRKMSEKSMEKILDQIEGLEKLCTDYWLDVGNFCRDPEYLYTDEADQLFWIYEPSVEPEDKEEWKRALLQSILCLGMDLGWEDAVILKGYHGCRKKALPGGSAAFLQDKPHQDAENEGIETEETMKKRRRIFPYFQRKH